MKLSFNKIALVLAGVLFFFDYSMSLGIILVLAALYLIKLSRENMEDKIMHAETLSSKMILRHFFTVIVIMVVSLLLSFLFQQVFNPIAVGGMFLVDRIVSFIFKLK